MPRVTRPAAPRAAAAQSQSAPKAHAKRTTPPAAADAPAAGDPPPGGHWPFGGDPTDQADDAADGRMHQVCTTVAERGVTVPAGVPNSAFDAGRKAAPPRAPTTREPLPDLAALEIDTTVPIPTKVNNVAAARARATFLTLLQRMQPGHSVVLGVRSAASLARIGHKAKYRMVRRPEGEGRVRVWVKALPTDAGPAKANTP